MRATLPSVVIFVLEAFENDANVECRLIIVQNNEICFCFICNGCC